MSKERGWYIERYDSPKMFEIRDPDGVIVGTVCAKDESDEFSYDYRLQQAQRLVNFVHTVEMQIERRPDLVSMAATLIQAPQRIRQQIGVS